MHRASGPRTTAQARAGVLEVGAVRSSRHAAGAPRPDALRITGEQAKRTPPQFLAAGSMLDARCSRSVVEFAPVTLAFAGVATMATDVPWRAFGGAGVALQFATVDTGRPARGRYGTRIRAIRPARHRLAHLRAATHDDTGASPDSGVSRSS